MPKRANDEGTICKRKDGRWVAMVTERVNGKPKRVSRYARTQREARELLTAMKGKQDAGQKVNYERVTLSEWLNYWLKSYVAPPMRSARTYETYEHVLRNVPAELGQVRLAKVQPEDLQKLFASIAAEGKGRTSELLRAVLRSAFNRARKMKRIPWNPVTATDPVPFERREGRALTAEDARKLITSAQADGDRYADLWIILITLGLRRGEAIGVYPGDVDLELRRVSIERSLAWVKLPGSKEGHWLEKGPKRDTSKRSLPLTAGAFDAVVRQLSRREAEGHTASPYLFTTEHGDPIHGSTLTAALHLACDRAGVTRVRIHDLRHSCGSFLAAQGVPEKTIMEILGHTQRVTVQRYLHPFEKSKTEALNQVDNLLRPHLEDSRQNRVAVSVAVN